VIDIPESRALLAKTRSLLVSSKRLLKYLNDRDCHSDLPVEAPQIEISERVGTNSNLDGDQDRPAQILSEPDNRQAVSKVWHRPRRPR
jgi:hypothetical protein